MTSLFSLVLLLTPTTIAAGEPGAMVLVPTHGNDGVKIPYVPQPGDIILFSHRNPLAHVIYTMGLCGGGFTHAAMIVNDADGKAVMYESPLFHPAVMVDFEDRLRKYTGKIYVRRRLYPLTDEQNDRLTTFAVSQNGKPYDTLGLLLPPILPPTRFRWERGMTQKDLEKTHWMCTSLVVGGCVAAGIMNPSVARPEGVCASDLYLDTDLDLSRGWERAIRVVIEK